MPKFVVPIDFSEKSRKMVDAAIEHAKAAGAEVILVHAFEPGIRIGSMYNDGALDPIRDLQAELQLDEAVEMTTKWAQMFRDAHLDVTPVAREGPASHTILDIADEHDADMIIIGRAGHNAVAEFFFGSTADAVVRRAKVPVLVVPYK